MWPTKDPLRIEYIDSSLAALAQNDTSAKGSGLDRRENDTSENLSKPRLTFQQAQSSGVKAGPGLPEVKLLQPAGSSGRPMELTPANLQLCSKARR
jgi:hypothetical protein